MAVASRALRGRVLAAVHARSARRAPFPRLTAALGAGGARSAPASVLLGLSAAGAIAWLALVLASPGRPVQYAGAVLGGQRGALAQLRELGEQAELRVSGLAPPAPGHAYQVWLLAGTAAPRPTDALFTVSRRGTASVEVPGSLRGVREVLVTSEPRGGSARPSSRPAVVVALPAPGG